MLLAAVVVFGLSSCLKDDNFDDGLTGHDLSTVPKVIELGYMNEPGHSKAVALDFKDLQVSPTLFFVRLAGSEVASEDITVVLDTTGAYSKVTAAGRTLLPASFYTHAVPTFTFVIPKGERQSAPVKINTNAIKFNPSTTYALYFKIKSVDKPGYNISGNFFEFTNTFGAKNKYDGIYDVDGTFSHVNPLFSGNYPRQYHLITTGANSVDVCQLINGAIVPGYLFLNNGSGSFFGSFGVSMTFDPATDKIIELHNYYGDPTKALTAVGNPALGSGPTLYANSSNGRRAVIDPTGVNSYNAGVVKVIYQMIQPSVNANGPAAIINETMTYNGPR